MNVPLPMVFYDEDGNKLFQRKDVFMNRETLEYSGIDGIVEIDIEAMSAAEAVCVKDLIHDAIVKHTEYDRVK